MSPWKLVLHEMDSINTYITTIYQLVNPFIPMAKNGMVQIMPYFIISAVTFWEGRVRGTTEEGKH